ncbi:MAG: nucleotide exchange factor GrpE [Patescibacteria group bacterium]
MTTTNDTQAPEERTEEDHIVELKGQLARAHADFINYRKDESRRALEMTERAGERVVGDLLEIIDSLEALIAHIPASVHEQYADWAKGIVLVKDQMRAVFTRHGVAEIATRDVAFDPALHEAIGTDSVPTAERDGIVTACLRMGYTMHGRVLRPAQVRVGSFLQQKETTEASS